MDVSFSKIGNDYVNSMRIEKFLLFDDETYVSVVSGREFAMEHDPGEDNDTMMTLITRKITETSHDIIYLEAILQHDEAAYSDDEASNLLYRQWLENNDKQTARVFSEPPGEMLKNGIVKLFGRKG